MVHRLNERAADMILSILLSQVKYFTSTLQYSFVSMPKMLFLCVA
jgi:hypothetical protein